MLNRPLFVAGKLHRPDLEGQFVELAVETEWNPIVLVVYTRAGIDPDIEGLVHGDDDRNGVRDFLVGDFPAVHLQHTRSALAKARPAVSEVELNGVLARRERLLPLPAEAFYVEEVVQEHGLALDECRTRSHRTGLLRWRACRRRRLGECPRRR